ncbi:T9SS type A sorting domain-containing protein [bacterium]|nr:T9SS type A sorting domain-containing protein [bacterium]
MRKATIFGLTVALLLASLPLLAGTPQALKVEPGGRVVLDDRNNELDEVIWTHDWEGDNGDWIFVDGNAQEEIYFQTSDWEPMDGDNWRCYDPNIGPNGGYDNHWLQWMISPQLDLTDNDAAELSFDMRLVCEPTTGAEAPYDGWDAANVWVSTDGGANWEVVAPTTGPDYNITSAYSFGNEWLMGPDIPGWGGLDFADWAAVTVDLSDYTGSDQVHVRFAFCSDPAAATDDGPNPSWTGFQVDNVEISADGDVVFSDDADGNNVGGPFTFDSGLDVEAPPQWAILEIPDAPSPTHVLGMEDMETAFLHMYEYTQEIDLTGLTDGTTSLDVTLKGLWTHPGVFPDAPHWTLKVKPSDDNVWYFATNPYGEAPNQNFVFTDAPTDWTLYSLGYNNPLNLTPYHGQTIKIRIEFNSPLADYTDGERYIYFDDFFVENVSYENDIGVMTPVVPFPVMVGSLVPANVTFFNNGTLPNQPTVLWSSGGTPTPFDPAQFTMEPGEERTLFLDNNPNDGEDGWIPTTVGEADVYARAVLGNDQNPDNNTSTHVPVTVRPVGEYEMGYDDRVPAFFYSGFEMGEGPLVYFTPQEEIGAASFSVDTVRVIWNGDLVADVDFNMHIYADNAGDLGAEIYTSTYTATAEFTFPNFQAIPVDDVAELQGMTDPFWIWFEITDPAAFPHVVRSDVRVQGEGHQFDYDGTTMTDGGRDYFVRIVGTAEVEVREAGNGVVPIEYALHEAYPNPFNPSTTLRFDVANTSLVKVSVFNLMGQEVAQLVNRDLNAGQYTTTWNASNMASGVYVVRMESNGFQAAQKVMLMK